MAGLIRSIFAVIGEKLGTGEKQNKSARQAVKNHNRGIRTVRRTESANERKLNEVAKEDFLLNQIDEFRVKAEQLQELLLSKEKSAQELQAIVNQRESKANDLQNILEERQKKADEITLEVEKQIDALIDKVSAKMDEIETSLSSNLEEGKKVNEEQSKKVYESLEQVQAKLQEMKEEVSEKIHTENVKCYRNIQDLFKGIEDKLDGINLVGDKVKSVKGIAVFTMIICILNLLGLAALALYEMGIFQMILG